MNIVKSLGQYMIDHDCPKDNDCIIYKNTYKMYLEVTNDLARCVVSDTSRMYLARAEHQLFDELFLYLPGYFYCVYNYTFLVVPLLCCDPPSSMTSPRPCLMMVQQHLSIQGCRSGPLGFQYSLIV